MRPKRYTRHWTVFLLSLLACGLGAFALWQAAGGPAQPASGSAPAKEELAAQRSSLLDQAAALARGYYYQEAIDLLEQAGPGLQNEQTAQAAESYRQAQQDLVLYEGTVYHIFFHSLIVYPELAFDDTGHPAEGYNMWMTTVSEFQKMLPLLLEKGFVLYDITELVETAEDGTVTPKPIYLPPGKKPLVLSVDDVSYYDYMAPDGFASRMVINDQGDVVTEVQAPDGTVYQTYEGDVQPILDQFVKEHPEFSWRGAKGVLAPTGYQGAFGYRITDLELYTPEEGQQILEAVKAISQRLRETGWQIGCHSYTHNGYWRGDITMEELESDLTRWKELIGTYTGQTNILITPFGAHYSPDDPRYQYMIDQGFTILCPVQADMSTTFTGQGMIQNRLNLDGYTMLKHPERVSQHFFDPQLVLDGARPPL